MGHPVSRLLGIPLYESQITTGDKNNMA